MWRIVLLSVLAAWSAKPVDRLSKCDVAAVYTSVDVPFGTAALTQMGDIQEVEVLLTPAKLDRGTYSVSVTRKASNIYRVVGKQMYLKTRYCYEYARSEDAILNYEGSSGYTQGELIFDN